MQDSLKCVQQVEKRGSEEDVKMGDYMHHLI